MAMAKRGRTWTWPLPWPSTYFAMFYRNWPWPSADALGHGHYHGHLHILPCFTAIGHGHRHVHVLRRPIFCDKHGGQRYRKSAVMTYWLARTIGDFFDIIFYKEQLSNSETITNKTHHNRKSSRNSPATVFLCSSPTSAQLSERSKKLSLNFSIGCSIFSPCRICIKVPPLVKNRKWC